MSPLLKNLQIHDLKSEYVLKIEDSLKKIIIKWLIKKWGKFNDSEKKLASVFIEYYGEDERYNEFKEEWRKIKIFGINFGRTLKYSSIILRRTRNDKEIEKKSNQLIIPLSYNDSKIEFLAYVLRKHYEEYGLHFRPYYISKLKRFSWETEFKKYSEDSVDWEYWLKRSIFRKYRLLMPCIGYETLQVKENAILIDDDDPMHVFEKVSYPRTVCPYVVKDGKLEWACSDKVIQWVRENNIDDKVTEDDIRNEYEKMRKDFEGIVKKLNDEVDKKKAKAKKDVEAKNAPKPKKQVGKKLASKGKPKTIKPAKKQTKAKAKKS